MRSTHFRFQHKVFAVDGARFAMGADQQPMFYVTLGKLAAALRLSLLCSEFGIAPDSEDGKLLAVVEQGLRFVKEIRPGDSIPRELLDGSASWSVEAWHVRRARLRLTLQVASPDGGREAVKLDENGLTQIADDPQTRKRYEGALDDLARRLGLAGDGRREVEARLDALAREFAYIEALRERYDHVRMVVEKTQEVARAFRGDRGMVQDVSRVRTLLLRPLGEMGSRFDALYAETGDIAAALGRLDACFSLIRQARDDLHAQLMPWDAVAERWEKLQPARNAPTEAAIRQLYQFAAQHYAQGQSW
jgi:hypothetical protein